MQTACFEGKRWAHENKLPANRDAHALGEAEGERCYADSAQLAKGFNSSGKYLAASPLHPASMATIMRMRNGKWLVTDGPFVETREE